jgi:hypothetical protein
MIRALRAARRSAMKISGPQESSRIQVNVQAAHSPAGRGFGASVSAKFGRARTDGAGKRKAERLWEGGGTEGARLDDWPNCSSGARRSTYATWHIFVCRVANSLDELLGTPSR